MSQIFDISNKLTNETPTLKITEDIIVTINNRMKNMIKVRAMMEEASKKEDADELKMMDKTLEMLIGSKNYKEVKELDLPISSFKLVFNAIMSIAAGEYTEEGIPKQQ